MNVFEIILIILLVIILIFFFSIAIPILIVVGIIYLIYWIIKSASNNNTVYYENFTEPDYTTTNNNYSTNTWYEPVQEYFDITVNGYGDNYTSHNVPDKVSEYCVHKKLSEGGDYHSAIASCTMSGAVSGAV